MNDWQRLIERRTKNIGFLSKVNGFREPTEIEKQIALQKEIKHWEVRDFKEKWKVSMSYDISKGAGVNLKSTVNTKNRDRAIKAYIQTPLELVGRHSNKMIDLHVYKRSFLEKLLDWIFSFFNKTVGFMPKRMSYQELQLFWKSIDKKGKDK